MTNSSRPRILNPDGAAYKAAAEILRAGGLVAFPTETVYGLGADATSDSAIAGIFAAKDRPRFNPLIVHLASLEDVHKYVIADERAERLGHAFWPGPLTLVLPRKAQCPISLLCSAGLDSLAIRVPNHPVGHRLLETCGLPLAAPSANASGKVSPTTAAHVAQSLGARVPLILDGGQCPIGLESAVVDLTGDVPRLLRPGGIPREELEAVIGKLADMTIASSDASPKASPGMLESHYAPGPPIRLNAETVESHEALLAFGENVPEGAREVINLSEKGDLAEAAARLFAALQELDRPDVTQIAVMPIPDKGLGAAICDRLTRAATPRPSDIKADANMREVLA